MPPLDICLELWARLTLSTRRSIEQLERWDLSFLERRLRRKGHSESQARNLLREYRRYMALYLLDPSGTQIMAGPVDEAWHEHILHTRDYGDFCTSIFGYFIHHRPATGLEADDLDGHQRTLGRLKSLFSDFSAETWPVSVEEFCDSKDFSLKADPPALMVH